MHCKAATRPLLVRPLTAPASAVGCFLFYGPRRVAIDLTMLPALTQSAGRRAEARSSEQRNLTRPNTVAGCPLRGGALMDFYQSVVVDYLRADRAVFVNAECCIQLNPGPNPDISGPHWYSDAVACDFKDRVVFLCEMSYEKSLGSLVKRLAQWHQNWLGVRAAVARDCHLPTDWHVRPWLFIPLDLVETLVRNLDDAVGPDGMLTLRPRITNLELVQPWRYRSWDHRDNPGEKPNEIPEAMRA